MDAQRTARTLVVACMLGFCTVPNAGQNAGVHYPATALKYYPVTALKFSITTLSGKPLAFAIAETPTEVRYELSADILFAFDQASLQPKAKGSLERLAEQIRARFARPRIDMRAGGLS